MTPEIVPVETAPPAEVEEAVESLDEAAITLDAIGEAIEAGAIANHDALVELLKEVRECRIKLEALSTGTESPALQQLLIQTGELQTKVDRIQTELEIQRESENQPEVETVNPRESESSTLKPNGDSKREGSDIGQNGKQNQKPQESNPSPTPEPKKKKYVKI